jgi:hypothetical protein
LGRAKRFVARGTRLLHPHFDSMKMRPVPPADARPASFAVLRLIWMALTSAPILYTVVAFLVHPDHALVSFPDFTKPLELMLTLYAAGSAAMSFVVPRLVASVKRVEGTEPSTMSDDQLAAAAQVPMIIRWALSETVAIAGFVIVFSNAPASRIVPFAAISFVLLVIGSPSRDRLASLLG